MANTTPPPTNLDAEESVLGAIMLNDRVLGPVVETGLAATDFYRQSHGVIYTAALELHAKGVAVDAITLVDALEQRGELAAAGGAERVQEIAMLVPSASNAPHYAKLVRETSKLRGLIRVGNELVRLGHDRPGEVGELIDQAESMLFEVAADAAHGQIEHVRDVLADAWRWLQEISKHDGALTGVTTGYGKLDEITTGWQPGNLIVLAARPGMGKTALALNLTTAAAVTGTGSIVFSLEMSKGELAQRLIAAEARVPSNMLRTGSLGKDEWGRMSEACKRLAVLPIHLDESSSISVTEIRSKARRWKAKHPEIGLIVIDYLQLIDTQIGRGENQAQAIGRVSRALKVLAGELQVPVIVLSQLSREVEKRADPLPRLTDLRDSGAIEQDADLVTFIHRPDYYDENDRPGEADVIVAKQRNGPTGTVTLSFLRRYSKFAEIPTH